MGGSLSKKNPHTSVKELISYITHSLWGITALLFVFLTCSVGMMFLKDSHAALCSLVEARLEGSAGPLSRELGLGEKDTSYAIFSELSQTLSKTGIQHKLELHEVIGGGSSQDIKSCDAGIFGANIIYPLSFGNKEVARVTGSISYISFTRILLMTLSFFGILFFAARTFIKRLSRKLKQDVINPIIAISKNEQVANSGSLPSEVEEIQNNLNRLKSEIAANERANFELQKAKDLNELATKVAHDIGSPLSVLNSLASQSYSLSDENRRIMVRSAAIRLQDIAGELLRRGNELREVSPIEPAVYPVADLLESIVSEKRVEFRNQPSLIIESILGDNAYGLFVRVGASEFKTVISNLINNAKEAIDCAGRITVGLNRMANNRLVISVTDNGRGIEDEILPRLMNSGATFNKPTGHGVGLYNAKMCIESWNGTLLIESQLGSGTTVTIELPDAEPPKWFVPEIEVSPSTTVCILDDEFSIHRLWKGRFEHIQRENPDFSLVTFSSAKELVAWHSMKNTNNVVFLIDYELFGQDTNGILVIESLGIEQNAILVTSRSEEVALVDECLKRDLKLISKAAAGLVPICLETASSSKIDCVLIDDDMVIRLCWKSTAESMGKNIQTFESPAKFFAMAKKLSPDVPIYIDSNLGQNLKGEIVAKEIYALGFRNIYLSSGLEPRNLEDLYWIKGTQGKNPPWIKEAQ